jgi:hypothetical protein
LPFSNHTRPLRSEVAPCLDGIPPANAGASAAGQTILLHRGGSSACPNCYREGALQGSQWQRVFRASRGARIIISVTQLLAPPRCCFPSVRVQSDACSGHSSDGMALAACT